MSYPRKHYDLIGRDSTPCIHPSRRAMRALLRMRFGNIDMSSGTIWIDITELFDQFRVASHATGVSRTVANLADALAADPGDAFREARPLFWHPILRCPLTTED